MEAMTNMGMAASQARFLGLTARKSNVEYQGQQINQQRTALSNESANLYNQMMELTVPTPPSTNNFYKTTYTLEDSQEDYGTDNYVIEKAVKTYNSEKQYEVTLTHNVETRLGKSASYKAQPSVTDTEGNTYLRFTSNNYTTRVKYDENSTNPYKEKTSTTTDGTEQTTYTLNVANGQFYQLTNEQIAGDSYPKPTGFDEWLKSLEDEGAAIKENGCYFYKDANGNFYFVSNNDLDKLKEGDTEETICIGSSYTYSTPYSTTVIADIETASSGRYSSITISDDENYPAFLQNRTFTINTTQEYDENGYKDAYNDYEYEKYKYEQAIANINAQTEIIQNEDQQLELRLQQLNTEQNAISTEMDSVSKVIEDNVEKTFKVFA